MTLVSSPSVIKTLKRAILTCLFISVMFLSFLEPSEAQFGITVQPAKIETTVTPGESIKYLIKVTNHGPAELGIQASLQDYLRRPDGTFVLVPSAHKSYSATEWVELGEEAFALAGSGTRKQSVHSFELDVSPAEDAEPGAHYVNLNFDYATRAHREAGERPRGRKAVFITVNTPGAVKEEGAVEKTLKIPALVFTRKPIIAAALNNKGNVHLIGRGQIEFTDYFFGKQAAKLALPETPVLPGKTGRLEVDWVDPPYVGIYKGAGKVSYGSSIFGPQKSSPVEGLVMVIYWPVGVGVVLVLSMGLYLGGRIMRRARRRPRGRRVASGRD